MRHFVIFACLMLIGLSGVAAAGDPAGIDPVSQTLDRLQVHEALVQFAALLRRQLSEDAQLGGGTPRTQQQLAAAVERRVDPDLLTAIIDARLRRHADEALLQRFLGRYQGPLVERCLALEMRALQDGEETEAQFRAELEAKPAPEARQAMARRLDEAMQDSEVAVAFQVGIARRLAARLAEAGAPLQSEEQLGQLRAQLLPAEREEMLLSNLYVYRELSDDELAQYVSLHEEPDVRAVHAELATGLIQALGVALDGVFEDLFGDSLESI